MDLWITTLFTTYDPHDYTILWQRFYLHTPRSFGSYLVITVISAISAFYDFAFSPTVGKEAIQIYDIEPLSYALRGWRLLSI